jgi:hypothetical protein
MGASNLNNSNRDDLLEELAEELEKNYKLRTTTSNFHRYPMYGSGYNRSENRNVKFRTYLPVKAPALTYPQLSKRNYYNNYSANRNRNLGVPSNANRNRNMNRNRNLGVPSNANMNTGGVPANMNRNRNLGVPSNANRNLFTPPPMNENLFKQQPRRVTIVTKTQRSRPVRVKLLKDVVRDIKKKKLVARVKKLNSEKVIEKLVKKNKNSIIKFLIKKIRPPYKKKKSRSQGQNQQTQQRQEIVFKNTLNINATGNRGVRQGNVQNMRGGYNNTKAYVP